MNARNILSYLRQYQTSDLFGYLVGTLLWHMMAMLICCFFFILMVVRFIQATRFSKLHIPQEGGKMEDSLMVIYPFRDEADLIPISLPALISNFSEIPNSRLVLVDSASKDNGPDIAKEILSKSNLDPNCWTLISAKSPGKSKALNHAMSEYDGTGIVAMVDADATIGQGSLKKIRSYFANPEIGAVSALESVDTRHPMSQYKKRSNLLRKYESLGGSCFVLEGSLLAWHPLRINLRSFDENSNADDAQIAMSAIRSGFMSIVHPSIEFEDTRKKEGNVMRRSVRRSQGLSSQLIKNLDLLWSAPNKNARTNFFYNIILHIFIPWCVLMLMLIPLFLAPSFYTDQSDLLGYSVIGPSCVMLVSLISKTGRALFFGSFCSVVGHTRALLGIRANVWNPGRG